MKTLILLSLLDTALAATSGTFNILSFNVAGLPAIINNNDVPGDKTTNTELIGSRLAQHDYDIVHVQEVPFQFLSYSNLKLTLERTSTTTPRCTAPTTTRTARPHQAASPLAQA